MTQSAFQTLRDGLALIRGALAKPLHEVGRQLDAVNHRSDGWLEGYARRLHVVEAGTAIVRVAMENRPDAIALIPVNGVFFARRTPAVVTAVDLCG